MSRVNLGSQNWKIHNRTAVFSGLALAITALLSACGGTGQDAGSPVAFEQIFRGVAVDGHIAGALVFIDYDNNGTRDPWEPYAFTDDQGYYSYNPNTQTDYCASGATAAERLHCLKSRKPVDEVVVRVDGGYDLLTGEPFMGQLSHRFTVPHHSSVPNTVISPLTTLMTHIRNPLDQMLVLQALGISADDLDVDYMNHDGQGGVDAALLNTALKLHKVVSVLSDTLQQQYHRIGTQPGATNHLSPALYRSLAQQLVVGVGNLDDLLQNPARLTLALQGAEDYARHIYDRWDWQLPNAAPLAQERALHQSQSLAALINQQLPAGAGNRQLNDVAGQARLIETLLLQAMAEARGGASLFESAMTFLNHPDNQPIVAGLLEGLREPTADVGGLAQRSLTLDNLPTAQIARAAAQLPPGTQAFSQLAGQQLRLADRNLGSPPNRLRDAEVEIYFAGHPTATSGVFDACVKFINNASSDGKLGDANTRGEKVQGFWRLLGANQHQPSAYSLLLTIEFLGARYQTIVKSAGTVVIDGQSLQALRFDYDKEMQTWHSPLGFVPAGAVPNSNAECRARLPSRVGL